MVLPNGSLSLPILSGRVCYMDVGSLLAIATFAMVCGAPMLPSTSMVVGYLGPPSTRALLVNDYVVDAQTGDVAFTPAIDDGASIVDVKVPP